MPRTTAWPVLSPAVGSHSQAGRKGQQYPGQRTDQTVGGRGGRCGPPALCPLRPVDPDVSRGPNSHGILHLSAEVENVYSSPLIVQMRSLRPREEKRLVQSPGRA